jgi:peptidoglycan hydrolase CwlO-like protein
MKTKKHQKTINKKNILVGTMMLCATVFGLSKVYSQTGSISDLSNGSGSQSNENQAKIQELERRAKIYRELIDIKRKQGESLGNQISIMDSNIGEVQAEIEANKKKIEELNSNISRISDEIRQKNTLIASQKKILGDLLQTYYQINNQDLISIYLKDENIASFMTTKDRISQAGDRIAEIVNSLVSLRKELEDQTADLNNKKSEVVDTHNQLQDQSSDLESVKQSKSLLLAQTKGEEAKYAELLERIEAQKRELLDIDQFFAASGLSVDSYPKPPSSLFAPTSWYFSQRDPAWGDKTIGNTKTLMKSYGCAVTAVAMVLKEHGGSDTPGTLAKKPIFSGDLINWPSSWPSPKVTLISSIAHSPSAVNWATVDAQIAKGNPVIVYIGKTQGGGGHYVVIHHKEPKTGKYVVHDPYFGANIYLDTTRALVGAMGTDSSTRIDQMIIYN